jgi:hypothetical protein
MRVRPAAARFPARGFHKPQQKLILAYAGRAMVDLERLRAASKSAVGLADPKSFRASKSKK